jgi:hypothetical protein
VSIGSNLYFLLAATAAACVACTSASKPTVEYVRHPEQYHAAAEYYYLTPAQRRYFEKRALAGDITAAKRLVEYHDGFTGNSVEYRRWIAVVARLEKQHHDRSR